MIRIVKILFFILLFPLALPAQEVYEIYDLIAEAYGGKQRWAAISSITAQGRWADAPEHQFPFLYKMLDPDMQRMDFLNGGELHTVASYGNRGWIHDPLGALGETGKMDEMEQLQLRNAFMYQNNVINYWKKGLELEMDGTVEIGDVSYWLLRTMGFKDREELYFVDQKTNLITIKQTYFYQKGRNGVVNYHINSHKEWDGRLMPSEIKVMSGDHQIRLRYSSYVFGGELGRSDFTDNKQIDYTTNILSFTRKEAQDYLHSEIPITRQMGIEVKTLENEEVTLFAPLALNANHFNSAFGGSVDSLFLTTGWAYLRLITHHYDPGPTIIGNRSETTFFRPITRDFAARLVMPEKKAIKKFLKDYEKKGKAKIVLEAVIAEQGKKYASFEGTYVIVKGPVRR